MWVSLRLRGMQPIDVNDLLLFARALGVQVHELMPPPEMAAAAAETKTTLWYSGIADRLAERTTRPRDNRPSGRPRSPEATGVGRTGYLPRGRGRGRD